MTVVYLKCMALASGTLDFVLQFLSSPEVGRDEKGCLPSTEKKTAIDPRQMKTRPRWRETISHRRQTIFQDYGFQAYLLLEPADPMPVLQNQAVRIS